MKINKLFAGISAAAIAATMCSFSTSAVAEGATSIDFEDGDCSFMYMNVDSGADDSKLSVEDYDGSKQLKVDVQDSTKVPKVWFDIYKIMTPDAATTVKSIEFDLTIVPKDSSKQLGWMGGAVGAAGSYGTQKNPSWSQDTWECTDDNLYVDGGVAKTHIKRTFLLKATQGFTAKSESPFFGLMTWANQNGTEYVMYIDNVVFTDDADKTITLGLPVEEATEATTDVVESEETTAAAETEAPEVITAADETAAETEAAPAETAAAETEAAPAETAAETTAAATTDAPAKTGNTAAAAIVAVMAVAGAAAVITKKRG